MCVSDCDNGSWLYKHLNRPVQGSPCAPRQSQGKLCSSALPCHGTGSEALCHDELLCPAQAVIFIFEHSESGSAGLILNRPTQYTIGSIGGLETLCPDFADNVLFLVRHLSASLHNADDSQTCCRPGLKDARLWPPVQASNMLSDWLPLQHPRAP